MTGHFPYLFHPNEEDESIPLELRIKIIRKTSVQGFSRLFRTCKMVKEFMETNKRKIKIYYRHLEFNGGIITKIPECLRGAPAQHRCTSHLEPEPFTYRLTPHFLDFFFQKKAFEYFHFTCLVLLFDQYIDYDEFLSKCEEYGIRCFELITYNSRDCLSEYIRILKPKRLITCGAHHPLPANITEVPYLELSAGSSGTHYGKFLLRELHKYDKGSIYINTPPSSKFSKAIYASLQKIVAGESELEMRYFLELDAMAATLLKDLEHKCFRPILEDGRGSVTVFPRPQQHRGFLVLYEVDCAFLVKVVTTWNEFRNQLGDFMVYGNTTYRNDKISYRKRWVADLKFSQSALREICKMFLSYNSEVR